MGDEQRVQAEWAYQWTHFEDDEPALFAAWIEPWRLEDFRGKRVLDAGCGPGHHIRLVAPVAAQVTGVDLNTDEVARERLSGLDNVRIESGDIATYRSDAPYDVVYCIGVIHHTDDPDATFRNLTRLCEAGGRLIVWCYSAEGNWLVDKVVEPLRKLLLRNAPRGLVSALATFLTAILYLLAHTLYRLPLPWLPYHAYLANFRRLAFHRNVLNVFDKLNAPQTEFITRERVEAWFDPAQFEDVSIHPFQGVSWRASGSLRGA